MIQNLAAPVFDVQRFSIHDGPGIRTLVFFKGCPLGCRWCQNPESQLKAPIVGFYENRCQQTFSCLESCPEDAILKEGFRINYDRCTTCGECIDACAHQALRLIGRVLTVDQLFEEIMADQSFYESSGGGVTFSGGEPTQHPEFIDQLIDYCIAEKIHTTIETSGLFHLQTLKPVLGKLDLIYFDLKLMDDERHHSETGASNRQILANASALVKGEYPIEFRVPLVSGITDTSANISATIAFLVDLGQTKIHLLTYHNMGEAKIDIICGNQPRLELPNYPTNALEPVAAQFRQAGISVVDHHLT